MIRDLADLIMSGGDCDNCSRLVKGVVVTKEPTSVTVRIGGGPTEIPGVKYIETGVTLAAGNVIWLLKQGPALLVIGKVV